jgi:uncharacterized protein YwbE
MKMQHTMILLALTVFNMVCGLDVLRAAPSTRIDRKSGFSESVWPVARPSNLYIEGTMTVSTPSTGFEQGASFTAAVRGDTVLMTALGPFGIVVARVYAQPDSFLVVNYLQQNAVDGDPRSSKVNDLLPIPLGLNDILSIVKCLPPGLPAEYTVSEPRNDGSTLFLRKDSATIEFALIDSVQRVIKQYQRKNVDGTTVLNVQYGDVKHIEGDSCSVPHKIKIRVRDGEHEVDLEYETVTTDVPRIAESKLAVPRSYKRISLR